MLAWWLGQGYPPFCVVYCPIQMLKALAQLTPTSCWCKAMWHTHDWFCSDHLSTYPMCMLRCFQSAALSLLEWCPWYGCWIRQKLMSVHATSSGTDVNQVMCQWGESITTHGFKWSDVSAYKFNCKLGFGLLIWLFEGCVVGKVIVDWHSTCASAAVCVFSQWQSA